jgi:hypothetical protein
MSARASGVRHPAERLAATIVDHHPRIVMRGGRPVLANGGE